MFFGLKTALMFCHKRLVIGGHYYFAFALLQFLHGDEIYCSAAVQAIIFYSNELIREELL